MLGSGPDPTGRKGCSNGTVPVAEVVVDDGEVVVRLSWLEKLGAFRGDVRVPVSSVEAARVVEDPWRELRGIRAPGTGLPGVIALGTRRGRFGRDFAAVYGKRPGVVIELRDGPFSRLVVSSDDPQRIVAALGG
jgi:hypothetical protein